MPSIFETLSGRAMDVLSRTLGEAATFTYAATGASHAITVIFNEFVGATDQYRRAIFTFAGSQLPTPPERGDHFVLSGETARWTITDVRDSKTGDYEIRADGLLERL